MVLAQVGRGDPHVQAHNDERDVINALLTARSRSLGDQMDGVRRNSIFPASKGVMSHTNTGTLDGYDGSTPFNWQPNHDDLYKVAEVNWQPSTLTPYGQAFTNMPKSNGIGTAFDFTTMFEGTWAMITLYKAAGIVQDVKFWIDDQEVSDWVEGTRAAGVQQTNTPVIRITGDNINHFFNFNMTKHGVYKLRCTGIIVSGTSALLSGSQNQTKYFKPKKARNFAVISDSWYDSIAGNSSLNAGTELAAIMGWNQFNLAVGGSGFLNPAGGATPQQYGSDAVFAQLAKVPALDLLLLNGSVNDMGYTEAATIAAMKAFFARWRTVRPDVPIVWQGLEPQSYFENLYTAAAIVARENALATVALADPNVIGVIRPALENWLTGTGSTAAPNGTGNQDFVCGADGIHLSPFGCVLNGTLVAERIKSMLTWKA